MSPRPTLIIAVSALFGFTMLCGAGQDPVPRVAEESIESSLQLRAVLKNGDIVTAGREPRVGVLLINTSKSRVHHVVKPDHGSELGTREPYITWAAEIDRGDGKWAPVPDEIQYGHCGTCLASSSNWLQDAVALAPGAELAIDIPHKFDFQQAGRVRLRAQYDYLAGARGNAPRFAEEKLGFLAGVPDFALTSNTVEFTVVRPLDVRIRGKRTLKAGEKVRLSDLIEVDLVNQSRDVVQCSTPTLAGDARLEMVIGGEFGGWHPHLAERAGSQVTARMLNPGEAVSLLGAGDLANGFDGTWEYPKKGVVRLRAAYTPTTWKSGPRILSEWVEILVTD